MDSTGRGKRVVVIGGGITGLTAAYRLTQAAQAREAPLEVVLLEASGRLGGTIATHSQDGLLLEQGPDCFLSAKPWGVLRQSLAGVARRRCRSWRLGQACSQASRSALMTSAWVVGMPCG